MNRIRCAIYTRKSSEDGLEQAFNSLDAQREACEAYIISQRHEGWKALPTLYDDGGLSGGNLDRPALKRLLADIDAGRVDMIVVYKIDRLTRSLSDFAKLVDRLDAAGASFVSVTQQFNTSTSMGRLTLNVLLSFAQFEREVTAERIRDKIAASKKKGLWMGGLVPLGYEKTEAGLVINRPEAETVRTLFSNYLELGCVRKLQAFAHAQTLRPKQRAFSDGRIAGARQFSRGTLYHLLSNPVYAGKIRHKDTVYDGLHSAIIYDAVWSAVQKLRGQNAVNRKSGSNFAEHSLLAGKLFDEAGQALTPSHASKGGRRYRYYVSRDLMNGDASAGGGWRLPASEIENAVIEAVRADYVVQLAAQTGRDTSPKEPLDLVRAVHLKPDMLQIETHLPARDNSEGRHVITVPFSIRRRGVEQKLVLSDGRGREPDLVLIRRILRADAWLSEIKQGISMGDLAKREDITSDFIANNLDLALLSPASLIAIAEGRHRPEVSANTLSTCRIPVRWAEQDALIVERK